FDRQKRVYFTPKISDIIVRESDELNLFDSPLYLSRNVGFSLWQRAVKRVGDIVLSLIAIILTSPIMLVTAIAIHSYDKGPVFYKQERYTIHKKVFKVIKFRSMIVDAEKNSGARLASENDDRITPVGHFIRSTRIDEIPQFFNILKGDMSFVGPRPERPEIHEEYCQKVPEFDFRLSVKAGLTGYAQVFGKYNTTTYDKLKFDMIYVQKASILLDMQLILLTLRVVFQKESTEGVEEGEKTAK
ncbi:MAG: exopolysaccharide biosynthesis polyprenyl glycosylphosphotransferase, partial [Lachnospiraceae bacterium]|nr:exopolysaccharide biosynthesis polyprenyl glycosylphosphotransferase [Lachnospiraceae bacterium]